MREVFASLFKEHTKRRNTILGALVGEFAMALNCPVDRSVIARCYTNETSM
jgi:hypothetical protein